MKVLLLALLWTLASCAAHNSHRIEVDPVDMLTPVLSQAMQRLSEGTGEPLPVRGASVHLTIVPAEVTWLARAADPIARTPIAHAELSSTVADVLRAYVIPLSETEPIERILSVEVRAVLDSPSTVAVGVNCAFYEAEGKQRLLAAGYSDWTFHEHLYCHGCRDHGMLFGESTISTPSHAPCPSYGFWGGIWIGGWSSSDGGYQKR